MVRQEAEALALASRIITAHAAVASEFPDRVRPVSWPTPKPLRWTLGDAILFPGPAIARKGAYEVREAARRLGRPVIRLGRNLEGESFWEGVELRSAQENWLEGVAVVVQPAGNEERPTRLLVALESGCPVVATPNCGLSPRSGLFLIPSGDPDALVIAIRQAIGA